MSADASLATSIDTKVDASTDDTSLTQDLVDLVRRKPITEHDLDMAALFTLDAVANILGGRNSQPGGILIDWAGSQANMLDAGRRGFLMGALCHILETDDLHRASVVHPGCVVVPAAFALADRVRGDGETLLRAVLSGFEACTRVGMGVGPAHYKIWHNTATCGGFGAAMAAADLFGLDDAQTVHALGNAGSQAAGLWQFLETGAMTKHLHAGHAVEAGIKAAELAALGFTGPPKILEGDKGFFKATCPDADPSRVTADPDAPWQLTLTSIKPWPSCRHTHPAIDAAQEIRRKLGPDAVALAQWIEVDAYQAALDVCDNPTPSTDYEAKFSLQHCTAAALGLDEVDFAAFGPEGREGLAAMRERVAIAAREPYISAYPTAWGSKVTVRLVSGETLVAEREHAKGDPEAPLSREDMIAKARMLLAHGRVADPDRLIDDILAMSAGGPVPTLSLFDVA